MNSIATRVRLIGLIGAIVATGVVAALVVGNGLVTTPTECQPVWPTLNNPNGLKLSYLKVHSYHAAGSIALDSPSVVAQFTSADPRNFAAEESIADYSTAFGLPVTDAQNRFYGFDPSRRVILIFSYGVFDWKFSGDTAAGGGTGLDKQYRVGMSAIDAQAGNILFGQIPVCR